MKELDILSSKIDNLLKYLVNLLFVSSSKSLILILSLATLDSPSRMVRYLAISE